MRLRAVLHAHSPALVTFSLIQELPKQDPRRVAILAAIVLALIFGLEEASQGPIQGRDANILDLAANYAGIGCFGWLAWWMNGSFGARICTACKNFCFLFMLPILASPVGHLPSM